MKNAREFSATILQACFASEFFSEIDKISMDP